MQQNVLTEESFISALHHIVQKAITSLFSSIVNALQALLKHNDEPLPSAFTVRSKIDKVSWTTFADKAMQVPEGLTGNLYEFAVFIGDAGLYLMRDAISILNDIDTDLSVLLVNGQVDISKRQMQVGKHLSKQQTFYKKYAEFVTDNGLSHQPIYKVLQSPTQCIQWYNTTANTLPLVTHSEVKEWSALLSQTAMKLDKYVEKLQTTSDRAALAQGLLMSKMINDFSTKVDIISVVATAVHMNRRAAVVFSKTL